MAALLQLLQVTSTALTTPVAVPATTYYFLGSVNVYTGDIATGTGVSIADAKLDGVVPRTSVKELLLAGVLKTVDLEVTKGTTIYRKQLRYSGSQEATVKGALLTKSWPTGVAQGGTITDDLDPRRVVSRK